jgi:hypothetical protein
MSVVSISARVTVVPSGIAGAAGAVAAGVLSPPQATRPAAVMAANITRFLFIATSKWKIQGRDFNLLS